MKDFLKTYIAKGFGAALVILGVTIITMALFTPMPIINGIILMSLGIIIMTTIDTNIRTRLTIDTIINLLEELKKSRQKEMPIHQITIDPETDLNEINKLIPGLGKVFQTLTGTPQEIPLNQMTTKELTTELNKATENEEFEKAKIIQEEINSRKNK